jgi:hypothetical protein
MVNIETVEFLRVGAMLIMVLFAVENCDIYNYGVYEHPAIQREGRRKCQISNN